MLGGQHVARGLDVAQACCQIHNSAQKHFVGTLSISLFQFKLFRKNSFLSFTYFLSLEGRYFGTAGTAG
jgi:hypothetical protein